MSSSESQLIATLGLTTVIAISVYFLSPYLFDMAGTASSGPVVPGLRNWANWCFCNSVLQSLASIPAFRLWLEERINDSDMKINRTVEDTEVQSRSTMEHLPLSQTMLGMIKVLNIESAPKVLSSSPLISALEAVQGSRISRAQQDAQEFLHMLLESIAAEQNGLPANVSIQQMSAKAQEAGREYQKLPFEGEITTSNKCTSCNIELKVERTPFLELTLLPPDLYNISLADLLARVLLPEQIEDYNCVNCQIFRLKQGGSDTSQYEAAMKADQNFELPKQYDRAHVVLERTSSITRLPQILLLHINRSLFSSGAYATRNSIDIMFPQHIDVENSKYELRSLVTHRGSHDRGHYLSFRRKSGRWLMISDETVRLVDLETVLALGSSTFMLFYEMLDVPKRLAAKARKKKKRRKEKHEQGDAIQLDPRSVQSVHSKL